jgi:hypothetical protein
MVMRRHLFRSALLLVPLAAALAGCDVLGIETASQIHARREAEGKAIGGACRHAVRSIEDCFATHPRASKAAVYAGWLEMDQYMRDNAVVGMPHDAPAVWQTPPNGAALPEASPMPGDATPAGRRS